MKNAIRKGFSFGLTSGVITTLGLLIGLAFSTQSRLAVIGGVLTIAVADSLSDALGMHMSEESEKEKTEKHVWISTITTAFYKFIIALTFIIPILLLPLYLAILVSIGWSFFLLGFISLEIAKIRNIKKWKVLLEHYLIAILVIIITFYLGMFINKIFFQV